MSARAPAQVTLGILAGGRATRLGGRDKAWLRRDGRAQVEHVVAALGPLASRVLVSANREPARYAAIGLETVADEVPDRGPLGGLHALAAACRTPWLLTAPVDVLHPDAAAAAPLLAAPEPAFAVDEDGVQPLFACWPAAALAAAAAEALREDRLAVQALQRRLGMRALALAGRLGNLNTPADLAAAGIATDPEAR
ncbi:molybdenum cofactor guanylyltransferase [Luteimonas huabeiensis]|uniref:molybdenum cofactor guanylyltransferase n=1 Tax=Luteimonas huabeiensis TaxID=1244513 RepID=UPI000463D09F|nr:molybdenum cofactor guanylyltransferase [Luteimonas huabeiensis]